jgi:hypothetical protein
LLAIAADAVFRHPKGFPLIRDRRCRAEWGARPLANARSGYSTIRHKEKRASLQGQFTNAEELVERGRKEMADALKWLEKQI